MNKNRYFVWISKLANPYKGPYSLLLNYLFDKEFIWDHSIETDANRASDGTNLRWLYSNDTGDDYQIDKPASVLEVMLALSIRVESMISNPREQHPEHWFWVMIDNLGLQQMTDPLFSKDQVDETVTNWMNRSYDSSGRGGAFPLAYSKDDQRMTPMWEQIFEYVKEQNQS